MSGKASKLQRKEQRLRELERGLTGVYMKRAREGQAVPWTAFEVGEIVGMDLGDVAFHECWVNSRYQVLVRFTSPLTAHFSIKAHDKEPIHDWRDLQRIKNELAGPEAEAIELYPAESRLIDEANQFHLWVQHAGVGRLPIGMHGARNVQGPADAAKVGARQRPFDPGSNPKDLPEFGLIKWPEVEQ